MRMTLQLSTMDESWWNHLGLETEHKPTAAITTVFASHSKAIYLSSFNLVGGDTDRRRAMTKRVVEVE